jgi:hypothetical protein
LLFIWTVLDKRKPKLEKVLWRLKTVRNLTWWVTLAQSLNHDSDYRKE